MLRKFEIGDDLRKALHRLTGAAILDAEDYRGTSTREVNDK